MTRNPRDKDIIVAFRLSKQQARELDRSVKVSCMAKQDFIYSCLKNSKILINPTMYYSDRLSFELKELRKTLSMTESRNQIEEEILELLLYLQKGERDVISK